MKKYTKIISLMLAVVISFGLTACSSTPDYSVDEMINKGYAMLDPNGEATRTFTLTIKQGEKYSYTFNGRISDGSILSSLTVSRNGLKSNYKNLFLVSGDTLCINMNGAMSATESEIGFVWTDSAALQNRYLTIENGYTYAKEIYNSAHTNVFTDWATTRSSTSSGKGEFDYNLTYEHDNAVALLNTISTKAESNAINVATVIDNHLKTLAGTSYDIYEKSLNYYQGKVDIDTEEITGEYVPIGVHVTTLLKQEVKSLQNLLASDGSYITEGVTYSDKYASFSHLIAFCDKDDNIYGSIQFDIAEEKDVAPIDTSVYNYISMEDFIGTMYINIRNAKGVGYETDDFPYIATYTGNQLTLTETNDLYKSVHVFDFINKQVSQYTVTFYTYDRKMHTALTNKYNGMRMKLVTSSTDALDAGTGSGILQYSCESLNSKYHAEDPIELLSLLEQIGVPTYGD